MTIEFKKYSSLPILLFCLFYLMACKGYKTTVMQNNKTPDQKGSDSSYIISAPIVNQLFYKKNGEPVDIQEYYIERSVQNYFIKFCEGKVSKEEFESAFSKKSGDIKIMKMEVEFREGSWDICDGNREQQSRIGKYAVILKLFNE